MRSARGVHPGRGVDSERGPGAMSARQVWIVEDEIQAATLAADLCQANEMAPSVFRMPIAFLAALRTAPEPDIVILDWRLEHELSAALFLATRHRYPHMPVIYWTGSSIDSLPSMICEDRATVVVDKAAGTRAFEDALEWAIDQSGEEGATG